MCTLIMQADGASMRALLSCTLSNMYVTGALEHECALLSSCISLSHMYVTSALLMYMNVHAYHTFLRCFNACPPIVNAYIATTPLIVHARMSIWLSDMYVTSALKTYMNVHSYNACLHCYEPSHRARSHEYIYIATSPLIVHARMSISLIALCTLYLL
jgi:hypothetical protein